MPKSGRHARTNTANRVFGLGKSQNRTYEGLAKYDEFAETVLPAMQADIKNGATAESLREKYHAIVQATLISTALRDPDSAKRLAAGKDVLDRQEGKAKERIETTHKMGKVKAEDLRALLLTKLADIQVQDGANVSSEDNEDAKRLPN
jgi:hypothetical protein